MKTSKQHSSCSLNGKMERGAALGFWEGKVYSGRKGAYGFNRFQIGSKYVLGIFNAS